VILANLLTGPQEPVSQAAQQRREQEQLKEAPAKTLAARILVLKDEGFFLGRSGQSAIYAKNWEHMAGITR
jgi:hypothetical protein